MSVLCLAAALAVALPWSDLDVKKSQLRMWDTLANGLSPISHDLKGLAQQLEKRTDIIGRITNDYVALHDDAMRMTKKQGDWLIDLSDRIEAGRPTWSSIVDIASHRRALADIAQWELDLPDDTALCESETLFLALYQRVQEQEATLSGDLVIFDEIRIAEQSKKRWLLDESLYPSFTPLEEARAEELKIQMQAPHAADLQTAVAAWRASRRTWPRRIAALWRQDANRQLLAAMRAEGQQTLRGWKQASEQRDMLWAFYSDAMTRAVQADAWLDHELAPCAARRAAMSNKAWCARHLMQLHEAGSVATDSLLAIVIDHVQQRLASTLAQARELCENAGPRYSRARQQAASAYLARGDRDGTLSCTEDAREMTEDKALADEEEFFALWSQRCAR